ncbi:hypothetical protein K457DRAFT_21845 [Linnemannia elongata AG-77]|uniref:Uncharacterized protein n=1 Tax=Linnemannia elongata AG-77 TaxID=1314771 RepID=A0A197JPF7_9FUNG|nr:hypothetical protein K457DRAFT_21845 [Linnemannia elongata AG-77]
MNVGTINANVKGALKKDFEPCDNVPPSFNDPHHQQRHVSRNDSDKNVNYNEINGNNQHGNGSL